MALKALLCYHEEKFIPTSIMPTPENRSAENIAREMTDKIDASEVSDIPGAEITEALNLSKELRSKLSVEQKDKLPQFRETIDKLQNRIAQTKQKHLDNAQLQQVAGELENELTQSEIITGGTDAEPVSATAPKKTVGDKLLGLLGDTKVFTEKFNKADNAGKISLVFEKIGEVATNVMEMLSEMNGKTLNSIASFLDFAGTDKRIVAMFRQIAGSDKIAIKTVLEENNLALVRDIATDGKAKDKKAMSSLQQKYANWIRNKLPASGTPVVAGVPPVTINSLKNDFPFSSFMNDYVMTDFVSKKEWKTNMKDQDGHPQLTLSDIDSVVTIFTKPAPVEAPKPAPAVAPVAAVPAPTAAPAAPSTPPPSTPAA
jgi:hypothetical protein